MKNDGGSAFPGFEIKESVTCIYGGMTLRDYFAAKAMQALLADVPIGKDYLMDDVAHDAYELADAMLKERSL